MKILTDPRSGSYQGITSSRNRFGQYVRTRAIPVQPRTTFQLNVRAQLAASSAAWRTLTYPEAGAWASLGLLMTRTDSLGQSYTLTGSQAHVSLNQTLTQYGQSTTTTAPAITTPTAPADITLTATASPQALTVAIATEPATGFVGIYISQPLSAGRRFAGRPRFIQSFAVGSSPYNVLAAYQSRFGNLIAGLQLVVEVRSMELGFESAPASASIIIS